MWPWESSHKDAISSQETEPEHQGSEVSVGGKGMKIKVKIKSKCPGDSQV